MDGERDFILVVRILKKLHFIAFMVIYTELASEWTDGWMDGQTDGWSMNG